MLNQRIPVTLLTGFLGSGKTTLLNRILTAPQSKRYAVVVNEFGEAGIDLDLLTTTDEELFEMNNGCVCCTVRGDLVRTLHRLLACGDSFSGVIIETTGLAHPGPVAQTLFVDPELQTRFYLDSIVTLVDSLHIDQALASGSEAEEQLAFADQIILNKVSLVDSDRLEQVRQTIARYNHRAPVFETDYAQVPMSQLMGVGSFDLAQIELHDPHFCDPQHADHNHDEHCGHDDFAHHHDVAIGSVLLQSARPIDAERLYRWLSEFLAQHGATVLRVKGIISAAGEDRQLVLQAVHKLMEGDFKQPWGKLKRSSRLVFIGRDLDKAALMAGFQACEVDEQHAPSSHHSLI